MGFLLVIVVVAVVIWLLNSSGTSKTDSTRSRGNSKQSDIDAFIQGERQKERTSIQEVDLARASRENVAELGEGRAGGNKSSISRDDLFFHAGSSEIEDLGGPWPLDSTTVELMFPVPCPGHFAMGDLAGDRTLLVHAIGRSDSDVGSELTRKIGIHSHFMVKSASDAQAVFRAECRLFHRFGRKIGMPHPMRKPGEKGSCPGCGIFNPGS